jgi:hypothetical protein
MEKMVTSDEKEMKRFMLSSPESGVSEEERNAREAYRYCKVNLCRLSQYVRSSTDSPASMCRARKS